MTSHNATQQFIEDAIIGGWQSSGTLEDYRSLLEDLSEYEILNITRTAVLDPLAWQAVGRTRVWKDSCFACGFDHKHSAHEGGWKYEMHRFIDHIADGLSIEEALATI